MAGWLGGRIDVAGYGCVWKDDGWTDGYGHGDGYIYIEDMNMDMGMDIGVTNSQ